MNTTGAAVPFRSDRAVLRTAFVVDAVLWLATAGVSRLRYLYADGEDWELPYAVFSIVLLIAAAATTLTVVRYTSKLNGHRAPRIAAIVLALVGVASTIMAWAFPLWAVLLAAGFAALAATGSRHARGAL